MNVGKRVRGLSDTGLCDSADDKGISVCDVDLLRFQLASRGGFTSGCISRVLVGELKKPVPQPPSHGARRIDSISVTVAQLVPDSEPRCFAMGKGNNSQGREKKKPKKDAKASPVKPAPPPKKK
jgi:hypothetical protein